MCGPTACCCSHNPPHQLWPVFSRLEGEVRHLRRLHMALPPLAGRVRLETPSRGSWRGRAHKRRCEGQVVAAEGGGVGVGVGSAEWP